MQTPEICSMAITGFSMRWSPYEQVCDPGLVEILRRHTMCQPIERGSRLRGPMVNGGREDDNANFQSISVNWKNPEKNPLASNFDYRGHSDLKSSPPSSKPSFILQGTYHWCIFRHHDILALSGPIKYYAVPLIHFPLLYLYQVFCCDRRNCIFLSTAHYLSDSYALSHYIVLSTTNSAAILQRVSRVGYANDMLLWLPTSVDIQLHLRWNGVKLNIPK